MLIQKYGEMSSKKKGKFTHMYIGTICNHIRMGNSYMLSTNIEE